MATTQTTYTGNGSTTNYSFTFPYLAETDVKVKLDGVTQATTTYSFANATTISMNSAPGNGVGIIIFRDTNNDSKKATFYPGSAIKAEDLNNDFDQILYTAQEIDNNAMSTLGDDPMQGDLPMGNNKLTNLATPTAGTDGTNKTYVDTTIDTKIDTAMEGDVLAGTDMAKTASGGQVTINHSVTGASSVDNSNGTVIQDLTLNSNGHVTGTGSVNLDNRYYTETELNAGQLNNLYYTETELNAGQLDNRYYTETELNAGQLDNRYYTESEADAKFYGLGSVEEIQSGETWVAADNKVATTSAIDARITDLVDDVGGFVPIANETSFPNANPDVNNGTGTLVSIKALSSNLTSNGSGVATIANGTVGNSTVTITGLDNSTTYTATTGMLVESTTTLNTYSFHRVTPKATEVTTVATNISNINSVASNLTNINTVNSNASNINSAVSNANNINAVAGQLLFSEDLGVITDSLSTGSGNSINTVASNITSVNTFASTYRISASAPSSSLDEGDLWYDSTGNVLKYYNGTAWTVTAAAGLSNMVEDTSPELGGHLDCNDKNLTEVGTVSGNNLQIDFGTLS